MAAIVAMSVALKKNCERIETNEQALYALEKRLLDGLDALKFDYIRNGAEHRIPGNVSLSFKGYEGESLLHRLDLMGICVSTGSACDSVNTQISHVINAIGVPEEYATGTIRISLGRDNTESDVEEILKCFRKIMGE